MALPGFVTTITLSREGMASQAADGTPTMSRVEIWSGKGHYQQQQGVFNATDTGYIEYQVYRFWLPFLKGTLRPQEADIIEADGYEYSCIGIEQESLKHHIIVKAQRVER
ncbi:hypothetical protein UFOVP529_10 [uncultured Caudovirales phage]|uniref:Uncharacterized protein n=1 Tax=uncultured Caudovirales phage TaxID=2100421 RepID=A0A6J5R0I1_9CAUD|nr:hypothetical protein UFOVP529_10 [uncultured Caudovirales phage]CAB4190530.1 hypothetical protein UFOVP1191_68 [uncultured Caudovirales phage]CAB4194535.1 hypothetical protein UFOVP1252_110 [uncultured Caudovirales phage]